MREFFNALLSMGGALIGLVLIAAFIGAVCGVMMWSCDAVRGLVP